MCACQYHYDVSAPCTCTCESHKWRRASQVEPEWVVGQQVSGDDYERLPAGSRIQSAAARDAYFTKVAASNAWTYTDGMGNTDSPAALDEAGPARTLTHLPEHAEPEDTDEIDSLGGLPSEDDTPTVRAFVASRVKRDLAEDTDDVEPDHITADAVQDLAQALIWTREYVQPKVALPAKKGWSWYDALSEHAPEFLPFEDTDDVEPEPQFNDDDVTHLKVTAGSDVIFDGLAVFEEADNGNVIVTPVPRCTSLFNRPKTSEIVRCGQHEGHSDGHWTIGSHPATSWGDAMQYGRLVESDGAS